jgi:type II secretory pathway pseudopilin PulG
MEPHQEQQMRFSARQHGFAMLGSAIVMAMMVIALAAAVAG